MEFSATTGAQALQERAGTLADGTPIHAITLTAANGISARVLSCGAALQSLIAPDAQGIMADVVLGYDDPAAYIDNGHYFGATIGRYANRIAAGRFTLDGQAHQLSLNDHGQSLHGGIKGFDKALWQVVSVSSGTVAQVVLAHVSPDGDQGYPGTLNATVTYTLDDEGHLGIAYEATCDKPTVVNMTNHSFFNLAGEGSPGGAMDHLLTIPASAYTPVNAALIPTGEQRTVEGTVFDFRAGRLIAQGLRDGRDPQVAYGRGYDHNFALDKGVTPTPQLAARLVDPVSGRVLEVLSTAPGLQFYSGNFLDGTPLGKRGHLYRMGDGIALEPQAFPDAPNQPGFSPARLDPGQTYRHQTIYRLSTL